MQQPTEHIINTIEELEALPAKHKISFLPREGKITLLYDHLPEEKKIYWEEKLSRYFFECGCNLGARVTLIFVFLYLVYIFFLSELQNLIQWETIVYGLIFVISGALLAKLSAVILYKYMLHSSVNKLLKKNR